MGRMALAAVVLAGSSAACQPPCESSGWISLGPEFSASGSVTVRGLTTADCSGDSGTSAPCADEGSADCCTWSLGGGGCRASGPTEYLPTDGPLPTWVDLACGPVRLAFAVPDLRDAEPGARDLVLPVVSWNPDARELPRTSKAGGAAPEWSVGRPLQVRLVVASRRGGPVREEGPAVVTEDFRVEADVAGAIDAGAERLSFQFALAQTAEDYDTLYDGCE